MPIGCPRSTTTGEPRSRACIRSATSPSVSSGATTMGSVDISSPAVRASSAASASAASNLLRVQPGDEVFVDLHIDQDGAAGRRRVRRRVEPRTLAEEGRQVSPTIFAAATT